MRNNPRVPPGHPRAEGRPQSEKEKSSHSALPSRRRRRRPPSRRASGRFFWLILVVLCFTALSALWNLRKQAKETAELQASLEGLQKQRQKLEEEVSNLESQLSAVNTDAFIEKYAHENLGMVKPNELIMEVESSGASPSEDSEDTSNSSEILPEKSEEAPEESPSEGE